MHDRKGIVNITDALVFIIILTVVASLMALTGDGTEADIDIEEVHDLLMATEIRLDRIIPGTYGTMPLYKLLAVCYGDEVLYADVLALCEVLLDSLTPAGFKASWSILSGDEVHVIGLTTSNAQITSVKDLADTGQSSTLVLSMF